MRKGDRVVHKDTGQTGVLGVAIENGRVWIVWDGFIQPRTCKLSDLQEAPKKSPESTVICRLCHNPVENPSQGERDDEVHYGCKVWFEAEQGSTSPGWS